MKVAIIYNPNAKRGKIKLFLPHIEKRFRQKYSVVDLVSSKDLEDMQEEARKASFEYDTIVVAGGDGSIHTVVNGIIKSGHTPNLGILPFGTCNDLAKTLNIPKKLDKAIDIILKGNNINYDLLKAGDEIVTYAFAGGLFVTASFSTRRIFKKIFGKLAYYVKGILEIFTRKSIPLTIDTDNAHYHDKFVLAMCLNSHSVGGFKIKNLGSVHDGKMDVVLIRKEKAYLPSLITLLIFFFKGIEGIKRRRNVEIISCDRVYIENHSNSKFTIDGESMEFLQKEVKVSASLPIFYGRQ